MTLTDITLNNYIFWAITVLFGIVITLFIWFIQQGIQAFKSNIKDIISKLDELVEKINKTDMKDVLQDERIKVMEGSINRLYTRTDKLREDLNDCKLNSRSNEKVSN